MDRGMKCEVTGIHVHFCTFPHCETRQKRCPKCGQLIRFYSREAHKCGRRKLRAPLILKTS